MNITEFRKQYPMYGSISDSDLANRLYTSYYSDMDEDDFLRQFMPEHISPSLNPYQIND
jgi:hypothetical protein